MRRRQLLKRGNVNYVKSNYEFDSAPPAIRGLQLDPTSSCSQLARQQIASYQIGFNPLRPASSLSLGQMVCVRRSSASGTHRPSTAGQRATKRPFAPPTPRLLSDRPEGAAAGCYRCIALESSGSIDLNALLTEVMIRRITPERLIPCSGRSPWRCTRPRRPL
jgi:hypothetical protein